MEQKLAHAIVRNENIGETIVIVVGKRHTKGTPLERGDAGALADVFECAIAAIAIKDIGRCREFGGRTVRLPFIAANLAVLRVPEHVARDEQVEVAVVIVINEAGGTAPAARLHACFGSYVGESAVAIIVVERIFSVVGYVEVGEAVIVVIADRHTHAVVAGAGAG